ncbi:hypothetical protein XNC3_2670054 [Xenorhabdus nematophila F1]|nr:hypothetical protein XNC3_2670054 [Xenorhabdus nematophila F1]CEE90702.1 hypothetical protein XNA1_1690005 [Xenorhabdus nematophila str. Anatoliense]CEF28888.1 hypothetical protein XNW1_1440006 [Xenorhabdus nematophila str. Websteri]CEK24823.1 protein of unknown function [Xenorhabdus nematophila AN6/1]CEE93056.1 hypothetical protein XNA1_3310005 [Xenorhabdus nematophila str. Anatoliense]
MPELPSEIGSHSLTGFINIRIQLDACVTSLFHGALYGWVLFTTKSGR